MTARDPIQAAYEAKMNLVAGELDALFTGSGFVLLVFNPGEGDERRVNFIANMDEAPSLAAMKDFVARVEGRIADRPGGRSAARSADSVAEILEVCQRVADEARKHEHAQGATQVAAELRKLFGLADPPPSIRAPRAKP